MLFKPAKEGNPNDPHMLNPSGAEVRVPEERVNELLKRGFVLLDPSWQPSKIDQPTIKRKIPLSIREIQEDISKTADTLEVIWV